MSDFDLPKRRDWNAAALAGFAGAGLLRRDARLSDVVGRCGGRLVYLATPYSKEVIDADGVFSASKSVECAVRDARWARLLALEGITAVSPVIQAVEMVRADCVEQQLDPLDGTFWESWCRPLLLASDVVIVPPILSWKSSDGIWVEVCEALRTLRCVFLIRPGEEFGGAT